MPATNITEKLIETRIINRHDILANWNDSDLILKEGEIALAYVESKVEKTDKYGKVTEEIVPTYLMKIGDGENTFPSLNWLAAPASDVYAWAKDPNLLYDNLPETLRTNINKINNILTGVGMGTEDTYNTVVEYVRAAIAALASAAAPTDGSIPVSVIQTNGVVTVNYAKLTNANIADNADISMSKIKNLNQIHADIYGSSEDNGNTSTSNSFSLISKVQEIINSLGEAGSVMEFIGTIDTRDNLDINTSNGWFDGYLESDGEDDQGNPKNTTHEASEATGGHKLQKGDVVATTSDAKEYIWVVPVTGSAYWEEFGHGAFTDDQLTTFANKVLENGLLSEREETLEAEFQRRTLALEYEVGITDDEDTNTKSLKERIQVIDNTLTESVPQLDEIELTQTTSASVLKINSEVLIFDCGTAEARTYLGE